MFWGPSSPWDVNRAECKTRMFPSAWVHMCDAYMLLGSVKGHLDVCVLRVCLHVPRYKANEFSCRLFDGDG